MVSSLSYVRSRPTITRMISLLKCSIASEAQTASSAVKVSSPWLMNTAQIAGGQHAWC